MRLGLKIVMVLGLTLAILLPLQMIRGTIHERQQFRDAAVRSIAQSYAGRQGIAGPVVVVPYVETSSITEFNTNGDPITKLRTQQRQWTFFPQRLNLTGKLQPATRKLGLHEVRVYELDGRLQASFNLRIPADEPGQPARRIGKPYLGYAFDDVRGLGGNPRVQVNGQTAAVRQRFGARGGSGVHVQLDAPSAGSRLQLDTAMQFSLAGTESLAIVPLAAQNRIVLDSPWPHPQFNGAFLPRKRQVGAGGFHAEWDVSSLASEAQTQFLARQTRVGTTGGDGQKGLDVVGISLVEPVNIYSQADRASKYGLLFVALTFVCFFMFELIKQLRVHPIQYLLVGLALAIFFLLLVALSEHIAFGWAYLGASAACIGLLGFYLSFVLHSRVRGFGFGIMLATLYGALYGLLISEDNALVLGAGLLFAILATIMVVTRKVDWYQVASLPQRGPAGAGVATYAER